MPDEAEAIVEELRDSTNAEKAGAARCEFNRKCDAIKPAADCSDDWRIDIAQHRAMAACHRPLDEKLHSRIREHCSRCQAPIFGWAVECIKHVDMFTFDPESFATRCQDVRLRRLANDPFGQHCCNVDHMLTIVEHKKYFLGADKGR